MFFHGFVQYLLGATKDGLKTYSPITSSFSVNESISQAYSYKYSKKGDINVY